MKLPDDRRRTIQDHYMFLVSMELKALREAGVLQGVNEDKWSNVQLLNLLFGKSKDELDKTLNLQVHDRQPIKMHICNKGQSVMCFLGKLPILLHIYWHSVLLVNLSQIGLTVS